MGAFSSDSVREKGNANKAVCDLTRLFLRMANNAKLRSMAGKVYSKQSHVKVALLGF